MTWAPENTNATNMPGMPAMATAYAKYINAKGGISGHQLKVLTCNEHNTTTGAADESVAAVVGSYSQHSTSFLSTLEAEGIPYLGGFGVTDDEFD
jgi:ABC-type branched-subunit amino acid transport system substrate-binding protein